MATPSNTPQTPDPQHYQTVSNDGATTAGTASIQPTGTEQQAYHHSRSHARSA